MSLLKFLCLSLFIVGQVHAAFLIDPYFGYKLTSGENGSSPATTYDYNSPTFGTRLGVSHLGLSLGVDYSLASTDLEAEASNVVITEKHSQSMLGLFLGYDLPIMFRLWGTYFLDVEFEDKDGSDSGDTLSGGGYGLGVGYTGLPFVSLNLEYKKYVIDEAVSSGVTAKLTGASEIDMSEIMFSVSLPINL